MKYLLNTETNGLEPVNTTEEETVASESFALRFSPDTLSEALLLTAKGLVGIFVVVAVIMAAVAALNRLFKTKNSEDQ